MKMRSSRVARWRAAVLIGVHLLFALHLAHLASTGETLSPLEPSEAMEFSKRSVINAGFIFFAITILSTLLLGRFFCGWACHLVALQDLSLWLLGKLGIRPRPLRSRLLMIVPIAAAFYMFAMPLLLRWWHGHELGPSEFELTTSSFWDTFPQWTIAIATLLLCGFAAVYFMGAKGFCTYACPYGGIFWLVDRLAPGRIRVDENCDQCGHCTTACSSNVEVAREVHAFGMVKDAGCMKCLDCVSVCPNKALSFGFGRPSLGLAARRPPRKRRNSWIGWREEIGYALFFLAGLAAFRGLVVFEDEALPFLFSLALAGVLAVISMKSWQLWTRQAVKLQNLWLKREGRLTKAGKALLATMLPVTALWSHAGFVRYHDSSAERIATRLANRGLDRASWRRPWFRADLERLPDECAADIARLERHAKTVRRWALVEGIRNPQRLFWASVYSGDLDAARARLEEVRARLPEHALYLEVAGHFALLDGKPEAALEFFEHSLRNKPTNVGLAVRSAELHTRRQEIDQALRVLDSSLRYLPRSAGLLVARGTCTYLIGDLAASEESFRRALEAAPDHRVARAGLVSTLFGQERPGEALQVADEGLLRAPEDLELRTLLYGTFIEAGQLGRAIEVLREACALAPERTDLADELQRLEALPPQGTSK